MFMEPLLAGDKEVQKLEAEIAKVGGGSWTVMENMIVLSPRDSKQTWPTRIYTHSGIGNLLLSSVQQRDRTSGCTTETHYQILLSLLQVLTQVLQGCCHSVHHELYREVLSLRNS